MLKLLHGFCVQRVLEHRADGVYEMSLIQKGKVNVLSQRRYQRCVEKAGQGKPQALQPVQIIHQCTVAAYHPGTCQYGKQTDEIAGRTQERDIHGIHGTAKTGKPHQSQSYTVLRGRGQSLIAIKRVVAHLCNL